MAVEEDAAEEDVQPPTPQDEQPEALLTDRERRALAFGGSAVGVLSGVSAFLSAYFDSGLKLLVVSALVVAVGLILTIGSMRLWDIRDRTVTMSVGVIVAVVLLLVALGAVGAVTGQRLGVSARPGPTPSPPPSPPVTSPATQPVSPPASAGPTSAPPSAPLPTPPGRPVPPKVIAVTCAGPATADVGQIITLTYVFNAAGPRIVGIGAGLYGPNGEIDTSGDGDIDEQAVPDGISSLTRTFTVPSALTSGRYQLTAEVWPANQVGAENAETLAESRCSELFVR